MTNVPGVWGGRKVRDGAVVSDKMEKTIVVAVQSNIRHRLYKKTIRRVKKYMAHDENGEAKLGDTVRIAEAAPKSRRKRWQLVQVLTRAELPEIAPEAIDSTLVEELAAPVEQHAPATAATAAEEPVVPPMEEEEVVQADAGLEALEEVVPAGSVAPEEPEVPPMEEEEVVLEDAAPEATEEGA